MIIIENNDHKKLLNNKEEDNFDFNINNCNNNDKIYVNKITSDKFFETNIIFYTFKNLFNSILILR